MPQTALISGGARGIGRALTRHFLETGYRVFIFDLDATELQHTVHTHLAPYAEKGKVGYTVCNLRDIGEIRGKVREAVGFFGQGNEAGGGEVEGGRIDVLVNNGGIASAQWSAGKGMEDWETMGEWVAYLETNLTAPFAVSQACIPYMKMKSNPGNDQTSDPGPCIIHIGSFRAHQSDPNQEGYASSKAGQLGLMHSMAISLQDFGIRVNLVAPGRIKVAHESKEGDEKGLEWAQLNEEKDVQDHPSNRAGRPEDIADAVQYLVNAGFVTGQEITVDGGATRVKKKS
ncbi:short chain alcohol dehydrogenase [Hortaea werneckii]|nr:short chain alcohol dehydrogenase [Hortaea werneckii]KAI6988974.1 short chain alcohol dehydrogenase [Hortaea werneckii]KAI7170106.1 short chain alcohol dehydrogenase [Hortaea werneckii]KAI7193339.1 short chain alcohol dehydrogenase [Hortaea werneckii]KAI7506637.1 short chain alcohol dehydrogenase [Hortaea werneckii]